LLIETSGNDNLTGSMGVIAIHPKQDNNFTFSINSMKTLWLVLLLLSAGIQLSIIQSISLSAFDVLIAPVFGYLFFAHKIRKAHSEIISYVLILYCLFAAYGLQFILYSDWIYSLVFQLKLLYALLEVLVLFYIFNSSANLGKALLVSFVLYIILNDIAALITIMGSSVFLEDASGRFVGLLGEPNQLAIFIIPLLPFMLHLCVSIFGKVARITQILLVMSSVLLISMTGSDGGVIVLIVVLILYYALHFSLYRILVVLSSLVLIIALKSVVVDILLESNVAGLVNIANTVQEMADNDKDMVSYGGKRAEYFAFALERFSSKPLGLIFGYGPASTAYDTGRILGYQQSLHNTYLEFIYMYGIVFFLIGLGVFCFVMYGIYYKLNARNRPLVFAIFSSWSGYLIFSGIHWSLTSKGGLILMAVTLYIIESTRNKTMYDFDLFKKMLVSH